MFLDRLFGKKELIFFLKECKRIKHKNGWLRIALPSIDMYVEKYQQSGTPEAFKNLRDFNPPKLNTFLDRLKFLFLGARTQVALYNEKTLIEILRHEGFLNIQTVEAGKTNMENYGSINLVERSEEAFYIECQ